MNNFGIDPDKFSDKMKQFISTMGAGYCATFDINEITDAAGYNQMDRDYCAKLGDASRLFEEINLKFP